jgi:glutamate N-acetyltransferase/amino-acid N-acetyltransferase
VSEVPCVAAGVFTVSTFLGEHVKYCKSILPSDNVQALITNSGQSNCATKTGKEDNLAMVKAVADALKLGNDQVLTASTGVIGQRMDVEKIVAIVPALVNAQTNTAETFATAIMTTDLVPKTVTHTVKLKGGEVRITGVSKGSGMIHPNMATMLGYLMTDVELTKDVAQEMLTQATKQTFNMISVDGEPSPCDSVYLMANGQAKVALQDDDDYKKFQKALTQVAEALAKSIVKDGEGATKLIEVNLKGAPSVEKAAEWARNITVSPLIKTAVHGCDPNWGRIMSRLGSGGVPVEAFEKITLSLQGEKLIVGGQVQTPDLTAISQKLKQDEVKIDIDLGLGKFSATAWGCDLSKMYVQINAEYLT